MRRSDPGANVMVTRRRQGKGSPGKRPAVVVHRRVRRRGVTRFGRTVGAVHAGCRRLMVPVMVRPLGSTPDRPPTVASVATEGRRISGVRMAVGARQCGRPGVSFRTELTVGLVLTSHRIRQAAWDAWAWPPRQFPPTAGRPGCLGFGDAGALQEHDQVVVAVGGVSKEGNRKPTTLPAAAPTSSAKRTSQPAPGSKNFSGPATMAPKAPRTSMPRQRRRRLDRSRLMARSLLIREA